MRLRATALASVANRAFLRGTVGLLPLDTLDAAAAYSLRRLRTAYTGAAVRVRRSSDNVETDIGFTTAGDLDTVALLAHVEHGGPGPGNQNGFVTVWYDQSGNARNATQDTAANQPRIVNSGVVELMGERPCVLFTGTTHRFILPVSIPAAFALSVVGAPEGGSGYRSMGTNPAGSTHYLLRNNAYTNTSVFVSSIGASGGTWAEGEIATFFADHTDVTSTSGLVGKNGAVLVNTARNFTGPPAALGNNSTAGTQQFGRIPEAIFLSSFTDTDRQALERNQGTYYGITVS